MGYRGCRDYAAWKVAVGCCCIQGGVLGLVVNCRGLFFAPVCAELGFQLGTFTAYGLFYGLACCVCVPFAARALDRFDIRIVLTLAALLMAVLQASFGMFVYQWQWYAASALQGAAGAFLASFTTPLLINNWFDEQRGVVMGIVGASSGIISAAMNPIGAVVIQRFGWRIGYGFFGLVFFLITVPASAFLIRLRPEGVLTHDHEEPLPAVGGHLTAADVIRQPDFMLLIVLAGVASLLTCYSQMLNSYGIDTGLSAERAAMLVSMAMIGNVLIKLLLGAICDRANAVAALLTGVGLLSVGYLLLIFGGTGHFLYLAAFLMGTAMAISTVVMPLLVSNLYGREEYGRKCAYVTMATNLCGALGVSVFGGIVEVGGYGLSIAAGMLLTISMVALIGAIYRLAARKSSGV